jgi:opine dehydrogenase
MGHLPSVTVCGAGAAGSAIAADLALKGCRVTLFELPSFAARLSVPLARGGIQVVAGSETTSGMTGVGPLRAITTEASEAVAESDVVIVTVPAMYHDAFVDTLAPVLREGQILLFSTGYWGALRQARRLGEALEHVTLAESNIMPYICQMQDDAVHIGRYKRAFCVAAFPGEKSERVYGVVKQLYAQYEPADTVLDTNIAAAGNPPIHVTLTIPIAGFYFDREMGGRFYQDATLPGARLVEAFDHERQRLAACLGSGGFESQFDFDRRSYGYEGADIAAALRTSPHAGWYASAAYLEQVCSEDIIYSFVPMVRLGAALGIELPLTRAMVEVMGVMLGRDYWAEGLQLQALGLDDLDLAGIRRFVTTGRR